MNLLKLIASLFRPKIVIQTVSEPVEIIREVPIEIEREVHVTKEVRVNVPVEVTKEVYVPVDNRFPLLPWEENHIVAAREYFYGAAGSQMLQQLHVHKAKLLEELSSDLMSSQEIKIKNLDFIRGFGACIDTIKALTNAKKETKEAISSELRANDRWGTGLELVKKQRPQKI